MSDDIPVTRATLARLRDLARDHATSPVWVQFRLARLFNEGFKAKKLTATQFVEQVNLVVADLEDREDEFEFLFMPLRDHILIASADRPRPIVVLGKPVASAHDAAGKLGLYTLSTLRAFSWDQLAPGEYFEAVSKNLLVQYDSPGLRAEIDVEFALAAKGLPTGRDGGLAGANGGNGENGNSGTRDVWREKPILITTAAGLIGCNAETVRRHLEAIGVTPRPSTRRANAHEATADEIIRAFQGDPKNGGVFDKIKAYAEKLI